VVHNTHRHQSVTKELRKTMKTRTFVLALLWLPISTSFALAQENTGIVPPHLQQPSGLACFKLAAPADSCAIVGQPIVNYEHPSFNVIDLNGAWAGPSNETPYIYFYGDSQYSSGYTIAVDLSLLNRPDGFGYMVDARTIAVVFPDDRDYTGTLVSPTQILWSNNTTWTKR
jgi:hypothetical protein